MNWYWDLLKKREQMRQEGRNIANSMFLGDRARQGQQVLSQAQSMPAIPQGGISADEFINDDYYQPRINTPGSGVNTYRGMLDAGYSPQESSGMMGLLQPQSAQKPTGLMTNLMAAGVDFNTQEGQKTLLEAVMKPQTQINQNLGGGAGTIWSPEKVQDAGLAPGTVVTQDRYNKPQILNKEKYTQPQILSGTYAARMDDATNSIKKIMGTGFDPAGIMQNIDFFGSPEIVANYMRSPEGQQYRQAQENWISANLRKESGAAIPEPEMDREIKKWFPYPGDKAQNIAQKSQARKTAERGMRKAAGGSYQELIDQAERDRLEELRAKHGTK